MFYKLIWVFGFISFGLVSDIRVNASDFGFCEKTVSRRLLNSSVTPPEYYKVNLTIRECCFGFLTFGDTCIPVCQNICINSHCIGNNECKCNSGYYKVDNFRCLPICEPSCGSNMACLAPNKCLCKPDYIKKINESNCEPTCSFTADKFDCINAKCVAPNICECLEGFRKFSHFQCEPVCSNCENGECLSPGVCDCNIGFEKNSQDVCQPICDPSCLNGFCVAPNICKCNNGFEKYLKSYECLEKQVIEDHQSCLKSCKNGTCVDGECICHPDFEMYSGKCSKKCTKECTNGKCLEDLCVCPDNYKLSDDFTACLPICSFEEGHDCIFGDCISPQVCKCFDGYRFLDDRNCTCVPMCSPGCINGVCTEKGCICHENFYRVSDHECIKNCSEGFTWVYDECIENSSIELFEETNDSEGIFASTTEMITSYEETSESHETIIVYDEGFPYHYYSTSTERNEIIVKKSILPKLIPTKIFIIMISLIVILIALILIMFCILYQRVNPKNIYHVNDREQSSNSVYFTKQDDPSDIFESSL